MADDAYPTGEIYALIKS